MLKGGINISWRIVYIEKADVLKLSLDSLIVKNGDEKAAIPLSDIFSIVVDKPDATITGKLINKLSKYRIGLVFCDENHMPCNYFLGINSYFKVSRIFEQQINWSRENKKLLWQNMIKQKIHNQKELLKYLNKDTEAINYLSAFEEQVELGDMTNREGLAAKIYFRALFGKDFMRCEDSPQGYNSALNYGYAILRSCVARQLAGNGLHPSLGIWHSNQFNQFNLADDCMEIFRPVIDMWAAVNFKPHMFLERKHRLELIDCMNKKIYIHNRKRSVTNSIGIYISSVIDAMSSGNMDDVTAFDNVILI